MEMGAWLLLPLNPILLLLLPPPPPPSVLMLFIIDIAGAAAGVGLDPSPASLISVSLDRDVNVTSACGVVAATSINRWPRANVDEEAVKAPLEPAGAALMVLPPEDAWPLLLVL